ncbi:MAG: hypothetical protein ABI837_19470, partial [Acidobacteriota bacterium]
MSTLSRSVVVFFFAAALLGCASTNRPVDLKQSRRIVGTENEVRIDAEVFGEELTPSIAISINYDITNERSAAIAVADIVPDTSYDPETRIVTVSIGSEVPGENLLPRLLKIGPGERKSFSTVAHFNIMAGRTMPSRSALV